MGKLIDAMERLAFGATAQERVDMVVELAARRVEERLAAALERITADDEAASEQEDGGDGE